MTRRSRLWMTAWFAGLMLITMPALVTAQRQPRLNEVLDEILHRRDDGKLHFGARVVEVRTGRELYAYNIDAALIPASNMKLPISAAALDFYGPDHVFRTYLAIDGKNLWLIGTGDPAVGDPRITKARGENTMTVLDRWADALKERGIERIEGDLYYYNGVLDAQLVYPQWSRSFLTEWYAAPVSGLNFNNNCIDVTVRPTKPGDPPEYTVIPPAAQIKIVNEAVTGEKGEPTIRRAQDEMVFTISGTVTKETELRSRPVIDPGSFFADALRTHLESRGITIAGEIKRATRPLDGRPIPRPQKVVAVHETKMTDILWRINKNSQNLFAEALCKMHGREFRGRQGRNVPGSWEAGGEAVKAFLIKNRIEAYRLVVADGSGLARQNRVTARLISDLLVTMAKHPHGEVFRESLSIGGRDGTLARRMTDIRGRFYGKTGYIGGVRSLSGYVKTDRGDWLVVSMIYNGIDGSVRPIEEIQDDVVRVLVNWPNVKPLPAKEPEVAEEASPPPAQESPATTGTEASSQSSEAPSQEATPQSTAAEAAR